MTDKERVKKVAAAYLIESRSDRAAVTLKRNIALN